MEYIKQGELKKGTLSRPFLFNISEILNSSDCFFNKTNGIH